MRDEVSTPAPRSEKAEPTGAPASGRLAFKVLRNGAPLGAHQIRFTRDGDRLKAAIDIDYLVKVAFVTLYHYRLQGEEIWQDGELRAARFQTSNNGVKHFMRLSREADSFAVEGSAAKVVHRAPLDWRLATHWNKAQLLGPMINPQDGGALNYQVKPLGAVRIADARGARREAAHFALEGKHPLELFYDANDIWTALRAKVVDGSVVTYLAEA